MSFSSFPLNYTFLYVVNAYVAIGLINIILLSCKPASLLACSGSRLGRVYHHDVRAAQHQVGTLCHRKAVCALKWSPDGRLFSTGCSDGLLTLWPHDPGTHAQGQPLKVISHLTAVKVRNPIAFQVPFSQRSLWILHT